MIKKEILNSKLRTIRQIGDVKNKRVLVRVDFDVPFKKNKILDDSRIQKSLPTIRLLQHKNAKIILLNHLGDKKATQKFVADYLRSRVKNIKFIPKVLGKKVDDAIFKMNDGDILLLENLRNDPREMKNDKVFTQKLAGLGDVYVNEAFGVSHRPHASIIGIPKYLFSCVGLLFEKELKNISVAFKPKHPFLLILGGLKFESKLGVLERFLKIADKIFVGGALANNFLKLKGFDIGKSVYDSDISVKRFLNNPKIILPIDVRRDNDVICDVGGKSLKILFATVKKSKFILWNGPLGKYENKKFARGTKMLARAIADHSCVSMVGGGDTAAAIDRMGIADKFSFISTGGGAMLELLAKGVLPGIEAILKSKNYE